MRRPEINQGRIELRAQVLVQGDKYGSRPVSELDVSGWEVSSGSPDDHRHLLLTSCSVGIPSSTVYASCTCL